MLRLGTAGCVREEHNVCAGSMGGDGGNAHGKVESQSDTAAAYPSFLPSAECVETGMAELTTRTGQPGT
jgi:hypothetical protein